MLQNVIASEQLRGLSRAMARDYETRTVHPSEVDTALGDGWQIQQQNQRSTRLRRQKEPEKLLTDRVWTLLYRMGMSHLSTEDGARLSFQTKEGAVEHAYSVVGLDDEVALAINCRASATYTRHPRLLEEIEQLSATRSAFAKMVDKQYPREPRRQAVLVLFTSNVSLTDNDRSAARNLNIQLFEEKDLSYYESLVAHVGAAARYQFLADLLPGKDVPGLAIRVPAVRTKMGGTNCYTFSITPEYLLKISYVSHRSKGKASDVNTYQRMLAKSRLNKIRQFISNDGIFPTNIVVNLDSKRLRFERVRQESPGGSDVDGGLLGWLDIRPAYKSAWVIDGQHRLFAYSGHPRAATSRLSVSAFEGLLPSKQAEMFIDINAKQKSVKQSLLQELYAELHWDAENPIVRVRAIVSKAVQDLDADPDSALYGRIQTADSDKDFQRCISLTSLYSALEKPGLHIAKEKQGHVIEYGGFWAGNNDATLKRTIYILKNWFNTIRNGAPEWWNLGSAEGGGLAMNDGVITCVNILRSVLAHLESDGEKLIHLSSDAVWHKLEPFASALGEYFGSLSVEQRKRFRELRGNQGQARRTRQTQQALNSRLPEFDPPGLAEFMQLEKAQTNVRAKEIIDRIEVALQNTVLEELRREFGPAESEWWMLGVPQKTRTRVSQLFEEADGKRGGKEYYFNLIDYRAIIMHNWELFQPLFAYGKKNAGKDKGTSWLNTLNERRNVVAHASSAVTLSFEQLEELEEIDRWLTSSLSGAGSNGEPEVENGE
jgi:DNA sulfur modification protein DndB